MRLLTALLLALATAASAAVDRARLADEVEAQATQLAAKLALPELGRREGPADAAPGRITFETTYVPELLPGLAAWIARHPSLDFSRAQIELAATARRAKVVDGKGNRHELTLARLRLSAPVVDAPVNADASRDRAELLRTIKGLTTSNPDRFLAGQLWLLRDLRLEEDGRLQLNLIAASRQKVVDGFKALRAGAGRLGRPRVKRVTMEPYRDQDVFSFELQGVAGDAHPEPPSPMEGALAAMNTLGDGWLKEHAIFSDPRSAMFESVRFETPTTDGRMPIDFNLSGAFAPLARLPALMAAARLDGAGAQLAVSLESRALRYTGVSGAVQATMRARISMRAAYAPPPATLAPPRFAPVVDVIARQTTTARDELVDGKVPVYMSDVRIEADGRVQLNVIARNLPGLDAVLEQLSGPPAAPLTSVWIKRLTWEPFVGLTVISSEVQGSIGVATDVRPSLVLGVVRDMLAALSAGRPLYVRMDRPSDPRKGLAVYAVLEALDASALEAAAKKLDPAARFSTKATPDGKLEATIEFNVPFPSK